MKQLLRIGLLLLIMAGCKEEQQLQITKTTDYEHFLQTKEAETTSKYFELWNSKIKPDSTQLLSFGIVAQQYNSYFQETGDIAYLKKAEKALEKAVDIAAVGQSGYYRALARNYISQHRFKDALEYAEKARAMGSGVEESRGLLFDVHMELGNYIQAEKYLDSLKNMSEFGYLIRLAKWNDHKGDLNATIRLMENAMNRAEASGNTTLMEWSYTNLADYYGHAGRIADSYEYYLKSLELNPRSAYAKKGIAWIVFSYEKNPGEALRILDAVTKSYKAPDFFLLKSEIAAFIGNEQEALSHLNRYLELVNDPAYGEMYNAYNVVLYLEETGQSEKAMALAEREVQNRKTPESYSLLAYAYLKNGKESEAVKLVQDQVIGKTFEPALLLYSAEIYKATGKLDMVQALKPELMGAFYELGPKAEKQIRTL